MPLTAKDSGGTQFPPTPEGLHQATCYGVIDIGTQHQEKWDTDVRKVVVVWELPEQRIDVDRDGQKVSLPRAISKIFTLSLHQKSSLRKYLTSWRGRSFSEKELKGFNLENLLGVKAQLQIIHQHKADRVFANIEAIIPAVGDKKGTSENPLMFFSFEDEHPVIPETCPSWIEDMIHQSLEWNMAVNPKTEVASGREMIEETDDDMSGTIPF